MKTSSRPENYHGRENQEKTNRKQAGGNRLPESDAIRAFAADDLATATAVVDAELRRLDAAGVEPHDILVATVASTVRDALRDALGLVAWEQRGTAVVCENVHRAKGTEYDEVILVDVASDATGDGEERRAIARGRGDQGKDRRPEHRPGEGERILDGGDRRRGAEQPPADVAELLSAEEVAAMQERALWLAENGRLPVDPSGRRYPWPLI